MKRTVIAATLIVTLALAGGMALAGPRHGRGGFGPDGPPDPGARMERMLERLDLTDEQWVAVQAIVDERRDAASVKREQMRTARQALGDAIHADSFDEVAIRSASATIAGLEADAAVERARALQAIRAELTPDQRNELDTMLQQRARQGRQNRPGRR